MTDAVTAPAAVVADPAAPALNTPVTPPAPVKLDEPAPVVAPAPVAAPAAPAANEPGPVIYEPTGDAGLDVALGFVGKLGIAMDHPAMQATATGDFSLIKAHLATMGDKAQGWEQMVALAEQAHTRTVETNTAREASVAKAVHAVAGGEEQWGVIKTWASANATPEEKAELNAMFDAGPTQARAAAILLSDLYSKANGTVVKPASAVTNPSAGQAATSNGALSRNQYAAEVQKLAKKVGSNNLNSSPEYKALQQRRMAYTG
jgi:hypothetical protein